ncbi:type II toxin-antitoxin system HigB family toxin [Enterobacter sp.]|uniref:type II toxin-antitoxin system HigB family toxin n=1 Tax=Enterobacter sp. TaxID=42895 RepID=UPI00296FDDCE|nr:type II toxin-antitoxin system HigB family toxin [Enterobacter sp.]
MHVISRSPFNEAIRRFPDSAIALVDMLTLLEKGTFNSPAELKRRIRSLDNFKYRNKWWVIDVSGNKLRVLAYIDFRLQKIFIKHIVTHVEYDRLTTYYREHKE